MSNGVSSYVEFSTNKNWATVRVYYSQKYDIESNASTVYIDSVKVYSTTMYGYTWWLDGIIKVNDIEVVNCNSKSSTSSVFINPINTWCTVSNSSGSTKILHNTDGTASINISIHKNNYDWFTFFIANDTNNRGFRIADGVNTNVTLTTIPRAASISSASNVTLGNACSVKWTPASTSFSYKLKFSIGSWSYTTSAISPATTSAYTYTGYKIALAAANQLPNATSGTMTATLYTYSSSACSTQIGSAATKTFTVTVPTSVIPTISSCTAEIVNSNSTINGWGVAVAGYTKVNITAAASGSYSSTISSFIISGGYSAAKTGTSLSYTGGTITSSGSKTFNVVAKDSRGRSSATSTPTAITFYAYSKPSVSSFTATRSSSDQSKVVVKGNWSFSSVNSKNSATGTLYYKKSTATSWTSYGTISRNTSTTLTVNFDTTISYNFKLVVTDALLNSAQDEAFVSTMEVLLDFRAGGHGLGIGKICESDSMEVSLDAKFFGEIYINGITLEDYIRSVVG